MTDNLRSSLHAANKQQRWIFVSHASEDLPMVRRVRNYLERNGGSPLLFHLLALEEPGEFWHLIEKEIHSRNFFLFCDSPAARESPWVTRERQVAETAASVSPKRIGMVDVSGTRLDKTALNDFLADRKVFMSFKRKDRSAISPFRTALENAGFKITNLDADEAEPLRLSATVQRAIKSVVSGGWFIRFIAPRPTLSEWLNYEVGLARELGATIVTVGLPTILDDSLLGGMLVIRTPEELVRYLLTENREDKDAVFL